MIPGRVVAAGAQCLGKNSEWAVIQFTPAARVLARVETCGSPAPRSSHSRLRREAPACVRRLLP